MNNDDVIRALKKMGGAFEVYHKTEFLLYRNAKAGGVQEVTVTILDAGENVDRGLRYQAFATTKDGKSAAGNPADSIETVLAILHWGDLDR